MNSKNNELITISGNVEYITYQSDSGYSVFQISIDNDEVTCVGTIPALEIGENLKLYGNYTFHNVYGHQFAFQHYDRIAPEGAAAILRYLSSGAIKGVGPSTAAKIVEKFGGDALDIIESYPTKLSSIRGITPSRALKISDELKKKNGVRDVMMFLGKFGISADDANKVYKKFGKNTIDLLNFDPYILYNEDIGFSYEKVVEIASNFSIAPDNKGRISAGILYILKHNLNNGHTCIPKSKLISLAKGLLECDEELLKIVFEELVMSIKIKTANIHNDTFVFITKYYTAEKYIADKLNIMSELRPVPMRASDKNINALQREFKIKYEDKQIKAINMALQKGMLVLTGGPGTGKTTTLKAIISLFEASGLDVALTAPTGRAAQRMSEVTDRKAQTIHRLLEVEWDENDKHVFTKNEHNPLDCDAIIIDEMSMVDSLLFEGLLRALPLGCRIIMVGDSDQLPSVGAGNVLNDIISSGKIPVVELNEVFRQALSSLIVTNAHKIVNGEYPTLDVKDKDVFMIDIHNPTTAQNYIINLCTERLKNAYGYNCYDNIQILCPSKMTPLGTILLNNKLQEYLNPPNEKCPEIKFKGYSLRIGDKVMQIKNNYDIEWIKENGESGCGIYNGDMGIIDDINVHSEKITIKFDDKIAIYDIANASQIELSYAITIHKSQGSEFDCIIIPLLDTPEKLCYRNLLYTASTRAKKHLIFIGNRNIINKMVDNNRRTLRYTGLGEFLKDE